MTNMEGETTQIETTKGEREKRQRTWFCQRCELSMGRVVRKWEISHNAAFKMLGMHSPS